jgi:hypothetical protein
METRWQQLARRYGDERATEIRQQEIARELEIERAIEMRSIGAPTNPVARFFYMMSPVMPMLIRSILIRAFIIVIVLGFIIAIVLGPATKVHEWPTIIAAVVVAIISEFIF